MKNQVNPFVNFMQQYDLTTADYSKIFDEHTTTIQYNIDTNINKQIINILKESPRSIIITGNAGDGKTRICRNVYDALSSNPFQGWPQTGIEEFNFQNYKIRIIKDLSELKDDVILRELSNLYKSLRDETNTYYLIAANEGKLTYFLTKHEELYGLKDIIVPQFSPIHKEKNNKLEVFNLLHASSSIYAKKIVEEWNKEEHWEICSSCAKQNQCIINHNHRSLLNNKTTNRLLGVYRSLDGKHGHMTMRELLIHLAYTHTGGLHCRDIHAADPAELQKQSKKVYYENLFGHNTSKEMFEEISGIQEIRAFDPGYLSDSLIDDFILNGDLSREDLKEMHQDLFGSSVDTEYGYFYEELKRYRLNFRSDEDEGKKLSEKWLPRLRRKYFFESKNSKSIEKLIPYRYRKTFLDILRKPGNLSLDIKRDLIAGLNTYFSKKLVYSSANALYVTSENLFVHSEINFSDIHFDVQETLDEYDRRPSHFTMRVKDVHLNINLLTFEYLLRLANGGMFNVLREDIEILLNNFRNKLISIEQEDKSILKILKFDSAHGAFVLRQIEIKPASDPEDEDEDEDDEEY
ncbi:hypothetical protein RG959_00830 [Domibacillus sp. 8LH]|uniref:hypothetical protein n=1 Tax=Domibacillus sp. 8LH TaxID=3073900 RepID=UPI00317AE84A